MGKGAGEGTFDGGVAHESIREMTADLQNVKIGAFVPHRPACAVWQPVLQPNSPLRLLQSPRQTGPPLHQRSRLPRASLTA